MTQEKTTGCAIRLSVVYRASALEFGEFIDHPDIFQNYVHVKNGKESTQPCMESVSQKRSGDFSHRLLHPQVRQFLFAGEEHSVRFYRPSPLINDELVRSVWHAPAPNWAKETLADLLIQEEGRAVFEVKLSDICAYLFPTGILIMDIKVSPARHVPGELLPSAAKMILNSLNRAGELHGGNKFKSIGIQRRFSDPRQRESVVKRFGLNTGMGVAAGLTGEKISVGDIFQSLIHPGYFETMLGDRYLGYTFICSPWPENTPAFSKDDYIDLVRISRGESDKYLPAPEDCMPGQSGMIKTFENVAFSLACEGVSCWVRFAENQPFLRDQFENRFNTIYHYLYLLCVHQRYALMNLSISLDRATPPLSMVKMFYIKKDRKMLRNSAKTLYRLRAEVANFYLRAFYQQPASLSNHQHYYKVLHDRFGIENLFKEVQQAANELEHMIRDINEQRQFERIGNLIEKQEKHSENELVLTLVVEGAALPYYSYSFLAHAFHLSGPVSLAISVTLTLMTMGYTIYRFKSSSKQDELDNTFE